MGSQTDRGRSGLVVLHGRPGVTRARRGAFGLYHFALLLPDRAALGSLPRTWPRSTSGSAWRITGVAALLVKELRTGFYSSFNS